MATTNPPSGAPGMQRKKRHPLAKIKGGWTAAEDAMLIKLVHELGEGNWSPIARALNAAVGKDDSNGRIGKQCRERWNHHLRPDIKKDAWTREEEQMLVKAHQELGNRWSDIAKTIPGRSENAVKNHWNATLRRRDMPDPGPPGPLKLYMQGLNLIRPQNRSRRAQQQPAAQAPARPKGRSSGPNSIRGKRRSRHDSDEEDETTCSSSEEDSIVPEEVDEDADHTGSNWYRHNVVSNSIADGMMVAQQMHSGGSGSVGVRPKRLRTTAGAKLRDLVEAEREAAMACGAVAGGTGSSSRSPTVSGCSTQCDEAESPTARRARACAMATAASSFGQAQDVAVHQASFATHAAYPPTAIPVPPPPHHMAAAIAAPCESHVAPRTCGWTDLPPQLQDWSQQPAACMDHLQPRRSVAGTGMDMGRPVTCHPAHQQHMTHLAPPPAPAVRCAAPVKPEPGSAPLMPQEAVDLRSMAMSPAAFALEQALAMSHGSGRLGSGVLPPGLFDSDDVELFDMLGDAMGNTSLQQPQAMHTNMGCAELLVPPTAHSAPVMAAHHAQAVHPSCFHSAPGAPYIPRATVAQNPTSSWGQMGTADAEKSGVSRCGSHSSLHSAYSTGPHVTGSPEKVVSAHQQPSGTGHFMPSMAEQAPQPTAAHGYAANQQGAAPHMWRSASSGTLFSAPPPAPAAPHDSLLAAAPSGSLPMEQPAAHTPAAQQASRNPIMYASADGPGRVLLLTTEPLPTMEALLQQYMPPGPGDIATPLVTVKLGSKGPVRVCIPELQARLAQAGIPTAGRKGGDAKACTASMVQDMSHMVHYVCRNVVQNYQLDAYVVAVRLGSATPLQDYSVLLAMRGGSSKQVSAAVEALSAGMAPLLC